MAKQYISIIRLLEHCGISTSEPLSLSRVRKQLNAEFGLTSSGFIETGGFTYTRQDVFEEIDREDFMQRYVYHKRLWESPELLSLLEKNTVDFFAVRDEFNEFTGDEVFDVFFSPYFAGPFNYLSRNYLAQLNFIEMAQLLEYEDFVQPAERDEAFRPLRLFLDENLRLLRNVNKDNYKIMREKIRPWVEDSWGAFLNYVPHELYEQKTEIVVKLVNIGVAVQRSHRADCRAMSYQLVAVSDLPEELIKTIASNHSVYTRNEGSSGSGCFSSSGVIFFVIFLFLRLIASDGCDSSRSSSDDFFRKYKFNPPVFVNDSNGALQYRADTGGFQKQQKRIDSLLKEIQRKNKLRN